MSHIQKIISKDNYCLEVYLDNGSSIVLNLESRLGTVRFGVLVDKELFCRAATDGSYIRWDNLLEISINEVFLLAQK
ncbi:MAG: hypothetical protein AAGU75_02510 [Bacillota bacterium]